MCSEMFAQDESDSDHEDEIEIDENEENTKENHQQLVKDLCKRVDTKTKRQRVTRQSKQK